jgi:hypothetical protein
LSKIWFFLVAAVAVLALSIALIMPRPAQRFVEQDVEPDKVNIARASVEMLLRENARSWIDLASAVARVPAPQGQPSLKLDAVLEQASSQETIAQASHDTARNTLRYILSQVSGAQKPEFVIALDDTGRVVARVGIDEKSYGDDISGYFLVRDALRGYLRDDLWALNGKLYRVAAAPVIARAWADGRSQTDRYVGAIVLGDEVDMPLAKALEQRVGCKQLADGQARCDAHVAFFLRDEMVASSDAAVIAKDVYEAYSKQKAERKDPAQPVKPPPFVVKAGGKEYLVAVRQLPGEIGAQDGYYAVFSAKSAEVGFMGTLKAAKKEDIGFDHFPWILIITLFVLAIGGGMGLMWFESDRPLRRLWIDAVALSKGEVPKLDEDKHHGRFGSIARSVNIALEKLQREAKASRKDLGAVLGPAPDDGVLGGGSARSLPSPIGGGGSPFAPPPPSDFSFEPPPGGNPVPGAPMHLPSGGGPAAPSGVGFDFDAPPPPAPVAAKPAAPALPSLPPIAPIELPKPAAPPLPAARPPARPPAAAAPPPPLPPLGGGLGATPAAPRRTIAQPAAAPPPMPSVPSLDDDILSPSLDDDVLAGSDAALPRVGGGGNNDFGGATVVADPSRELLEASSDSEGAYFREVFEDFLELKRKCGEPLENLTFDKFAAKLRANRDQLIAKYNCKSVKFQVYVKDGKAALKATPVKS